VSVAKDAAEQRAKNSVGSRDAWQIADPIGQQTAVGSLLERALVFPHALREHARALAKARWRIQFHERDVVPVDRKHAAEQHERAADALSQLHGAKSVAAQARRRGHPKNRPQLVVDAGRRAHASPHSVARREQQRARDDRTAQLAHRASPGRMNMISGTTHAGETFSR
jgi:hypothetical protein